MRRVLTLGDDVRGRGREIPFEPSAWSLPNQVSKKNGILVRLKEHFRRKRIRTIEAEDILAYRQWRAEQGVGSSLVNMEVAVVRRVLNVRGPRGIPGPRHPSRSGPQM